MKRYVIGLLGLVLIGGVVVLVYFKDKKIDDSSKQIKALEDILSATSSSSLADKPIIKIEPADEVDPNIFYKGQAINEPGNDKLLKEISKSVLDTYTKELERLNDALKSNPLDIESWMRLGQIKKVFNNYEGARDAFEYVKYIIEPNALLNYNLANLYGFDLKDSEKAIFYYEEALRLEPNNYNYVIGAIEFYRALNDKKSKVEELMQKAILLNSNDASLMAYIGRYYQDLGDKNKAIEYYEKALELSPGDAFIKSDIEKLKSE